VVVVLPRKGIGNADRLVSHSYGLTGVNAGYFSRIRIWDIRTDVIWEFCWMQKLRTRPPRNPIGVITLSVYGNLYRLGVCGPWTGDLGMALFMGTGVL
jgi:hypothetical protein